MNSLSWFIYFADIVPKIANGLLLAFIVGLIASFLMYLGMMCVNSDKKFERNPTPPINIKKYLWLIPLFVFCGAISLILPSKNTMYAIAASELGEEVYKSEQGQRIVKQLSEWVSAQLKVKE